MRTSDMIKSNFISRAEVKNAGQMILTVIDCTMEKVGSDDKWVLWFNEHPKGLSLNNTKIRLLEAAYGDDSTYWNGRRVRLTFDPTVTMAGQVVGGIKLTCSTAGVTAARAAAGGPVARSAAPPGTPAPPVAQWDGTRWVLPEPSPPPNAEFDQSTGEILQQAQQPVPRRPLTISERVNAGNPPVGGLGPVGSADNEFGDDIPF